MDRIQLKALETKYAKALISLKTLSDSLKEVGDELNSEQVGLGDAILGLSQLTKELHADCSSSRSLKGIWRGRSMKDRVTRKYSKVAMKGMRTKERRQRRA